ncbi:hypothetical protein BCR44DRAFT_1497790 [Catenaria anguillulae PL171]|uniref:Ankyrin repeat-containing domain protein n=1 Tax=Catenaria anguillulae PL171 TaxID=765915 RepID=A0A1Y2HT34_9FUNG|nr:hypothetical protein BCR44DRAFT_1497790 [Catenaria anguillulae PL171]
MEESLTVMPTLPLPLVELILAFAPHTYPRSTTYLALARVLPPSHVPQAYTSIFTRANSAPGMDLVDMLLENDQSHASFFDANDAFLGLDSCKQPQPQPQCKSVSGRAEILGKVEQYLLQRPPTQALVQIAQHCCRMGDWKVIDRVWPDKGIRMTRHLSETLLASASEAGNVDVFQALCFAMGVSHQAKPARHLLLAACNGHAAFIQFLLQDQVLGLDGLDMFYIIQLACVGGHVAVLDMVMHERAGELLSEEAWRYAAEYNWVHVLDWLRQKQVAEPIGEAFGWVDWASKNGHLGVLDWFYENTDRTHYTPAAVEWASEEGRLDVIEWWLFKTDLVFKFSPGATWQAHKRGHTLVSRFWDQCEPYAILISPDSQLTDAQVALVPRDAPTLASFGRLDLMLRFDLVKFSEVDASDRFSVKCLLSTMEHAALFGHIHILEHLLNVNYNVAHDFMSDAAGLFISAALPGDRVNVVQWLVARFPDADECFDWSSPLVELVELEARCMLEWMYRTRRCKPPVLVDVVRAACRVGDVEMLNLLFAKGLDVDALNEDDSALIVASRQGHVAVLQWWVSNKLPIPRSTRPVDYASQAGQRIVLDWWLNDSESEFWWSEAAIRWAVAKGQAKVVQWWLKSGLVKDSDLLELLQSGLSPTTL